MSIISNASTPSTKSSSKLLRQGSLLSYRGVAVEMNADDYIAKMEEMNDLLMNLEERMNKVEAKLEEADELLINHEQKHNKLAAIEKEITKEKQALKKLEKQHCEFKI